MALKKNKVKFGLNKVHWAKITGWSDDGVPTFATPVRLPGAVSLSIDANGENENFYADDTVYYVINNNAGYTGDLEVALITTDFATEIPVNSLTARAFWSSEMTRRLRSLRCFSSSPAIKTRSVMCCTAARHPVPQQRAALWRRAPRSRPRHCR